jgi:hypothetical protein
MIVKHIGVVIEKLIVLTTGHIISMMNVNVLKNFNN